MSACVSERYVSATSILRKAAEQEREHLKATIAELGAEYGQIRNKLKDAHAKLMEVNMKLERLGNENS